VLVAISLGLGRILNNRHPPIPTFKLDARKFGMCLTILCDVRPNVVVEQLVIR
jgi:hypothetical protein